MDRPARLALPVVVLAAIVVSLRGIAGFEPVREWADLRTLVLLSRALWSLVAVVGFPAVGYALGRRTDDASPPGPLAVELASVGVFATLDAATFGLLVLGGYALSGGDGAG